VHQSAKEKYFENFLKTLIKFWFIRIKPNKNFSSTYLERLKIYILLEIIVKKW